MAKNKRRSSVHKIEIPYSFRCESCLQDSGELLFVLTIANAAQKNTIKAKGAPKAKLTREENVRKNVAGEVAMTMRNAYDQGIYPPGVRDICPHCKSTQSWALAGLKSRRYLGFAVLVCMGVLGGLYVLANPEGALKLNMAQRGIIAALVFVVLSLLGLISLIVNNTKIRRRTKHLPFATDARRGERAKADERVAASTPTVDWERALEYVSSLGNSI